MGKLPWRLWGHFSPESWSQTAPVQVILYLLLSLAPSVKRAATATWSGVGTSWLHPKKAVAAMWTWRSAALWIWRWACCPFQPTGGNWHLLPGRSGLGDHDSGIPGRVLQGCAPVFCVVGIFTTTHGVDVPTWAKAI